MRTTRTKRRKPRTRKRKSLGSVRRRRTRKESAEDEKAHDNEEGE